MASVVNSTGTQPRPKRISNVGLCLASGGAVREAGPLTAGNRFALTDDSKLVSGLRFAWKLASEGVEEDVICDLWDASGTKIDTVTVPVLASGACSGTFPSTHTFSAYTIFTISVYTASAYPGFALSSLPSGMRAPPFIAAYGDAHPYSLYFGEGILYVDGYYLSGSHGYPTSQNNPGGIVIPVDPILVGDPR